MTVSILKVWYQNDWGLYGRRDERIARWLARDPRVGTVLHLEPPLILSKLKTIAARPSFEDNLETNVARLRGSRDGDVHLFTPGIADVNVDPLTARESVAWQIVERCRQLRILDGPYVLWLSAPGALSDLVLEVLGKDANRIVVELEDDHRCYSPPGSERREAIEKIYEKLLASSDIAFSVSEQLAEEYKEIQPHFLHVPNAVEEEEYTATLAPPEWFAELPRPIATYVGNLSLRLDWEILEETARALDGGTLLLVGPPGERVRALASRHSSVLLAGPRRASEVPAILSASEVLVMPHEVSVMTQGMDPQKLHEYLASGTAVVTTPVEGTKRYRDSIRIEASAAGFARATLEAANEALPEAEEARRRVGLSRPWSRVVSSMLDTILAVEGAGERFGVVRKKRYYRLERPEVRALVPRDARRVLDIGCGEGALGAALAREIGCEVWGVEIEPEPAAVAGEALERVIVGDARDVCRDLGSEHFDAVVLADVLEHVAEPGPLLDEIARILAPDGVLVASVPNVRHWSVLREILEGDFRYREAGILDETHLRFYTRKSLTRLLSNHGFAVSDVSGHSWSRENAPQGIVDALARAGLDVGSLGEESGIHQLLVVARSTTDRRPRKRETPTEEPMFGTLTQTIPLLLSSLSLTRSRSRDSSLQSLRERTSAGSWRLVVVDNGSRDGTADLLRSQPGRDGCDRTDESRVCRRVQ